MNIEDRIAEAAIKCESAFWYHVSKQFPEIKSGDMSLKDQAEFSEAVGKAIEAWVEGNMS